MKALAAHIRKIHLAGARAVAVELDDGFLKISAGVDRLLQDRAELIAALHYLLERDARSPFLSPGDEKMVRATIEKVGRT